MAQTIRLLSTYNGNPPGTIITVDDAIASQLLSGGVNATTNLTGGTTNYLEQGSTSAPGVSTVVAGRRATITLTKGFRLRVTGIATAEVLGADGQAEQTSRAGTSAPVQVGPFLTDRQVRVTGRFGNTTVEYFSPDATPKPASSIMWLGDSITALSSAMPNTPQDRGTRILGPALTNINSLGLFLIRLEAGPTCAAGNGTLRWWAADGAYSWQANGDTEGPRVLVPTAGFYTFPSGAAGNELYAGVVSRFRPLTDKSDAINVTGAFRLRNNTASAGIMGWSQALTNNAFAESVCYAISTIKASEWLAARAQWESRYTDVTHVFLGTNDVQDAASGVQALLDIETIVRSRQAIGSKVIVGCLLPADARTADATAAAVEFNRGIRELGGRLNFEVWDAWNFVYNPSGTGAYTTGMSKDGLHPTSLGAYSIAKSCIVPILRKYIRPADPQLFAGAKYNAATAPYGNLLANGQLTGTTGNATVQAGVTGQVPTGWICARDIGTTMTAVSKAPDSASPVLRTDGRQGAYWSIDISNAGGANGDSLRCRLQSFVTAGFAAGDLVVLEGDLQVSGTGMQAVEACLTLTGGVGTRNGLALFVDTDPTGPMGNLAGDTATVPFKSKPFRIETGDTSLNVWITMYMQANGTARLNVGQSLNLHKVPVV